MVCIGKGQQPRNCIHPSISDPSGSHLYFFGKDWFLREQEELKSVVNTTRVATVRLGPFMTTNVIRPHGFQIILDRAGEERFDTWLRGRYPELLDDYRQWQDAGRRYTHPFIVELYKKENGRYWADMQAAQAVLETSASGSAALS